MAEGILRPGGAAPRSVSRRGPTPGFSEPERVPWSELGPDFIETWGHDDDGKLRAEHLEVAGQSGSGKSYAIATILQQRAQRWDSAEVAVLTKESDDSLPLLGWPEAATLKELRQWQQAVFWPRSGAMGEEREQHMEAQLYDLLASLWKKDANCVLYFDEIGFIEDLSKRLKKMTRQYWREGRSHGISVIASKQRPLGINRDAHSESRWKIVFCPSDEGDMERFAQLLGKPADWEPVLRDLDQERHEFVIRNSFTKASYISWIDLDLKPVKAQTPEGQQRQPEDPYHRRK